MSISTLEREGRFPKVELRIKPLDVTKPTITLVDFLEYKYESSILIPVDSFSFSFAAPSDTRPFSAYFREGDIAQLFGNGVQLATGIIDQIEVDVDIDLSEKITVTGRDLMAGLEDQDAISLESEAFYTANATIDSVFKTLTVSTRIQKLRKQQAPAAGYLFATEPSESRLSALTRYMDPLNILAWMDPDGTLVIGRPNFEQAPIGTWVVSKSKRISNVIAMKATFAAASVPNAIVPVWVGEERVVDLVPKTRVLFNRAAGPARLRTLGMPLSKSIVVSNPEGDRPQDLAEINRIVAGNSDLLGAYAKREIARQNIRELLVQCSVAGHYDVNGNPFRPDTVYHIQNDRAGIDQKMYCYQVEYALGLETSQRTDLFFCNLNTIVSDSRAT